MVFVSRRTYYNRQEGEKRMLETHIKMIEDVQKGLVDAVQNRMFTPEDCWSDVVNAIDILSWTFGPPAERHTHPDDEKHFSDLVVPLVRAAWNRGERPDGMWKWYEAHRPTRQAYSINSKRWM